MGYVVNQLLGDVNSSLHSYSGVLERVLSVGDARVAHDESCR